MSTAWIVALVVLVWVVGLPAAWVGYVEWVRRADR